MATHQNDQQQPHGFPWIPGGHGANGLGRGVGDASGENPGGGENAG